MASLKYKFVVCVMVAAWIISSKGQSMEDYSARVYVDGHKIISLDDEGTLISEGVAGRDDSAIIRNTIQHVKRGCILFVGSFRITTSIDNLTSDICLRGTPGKTFFDCSSINDEAFLAGDKGYNSLVAELISDASSGDYAIEVEGVESYSPGDIVKLIDDTDIIGFKKGEILHIKRIIGDEIEFTEPLRDNYYVEKNANIRKLSMVHNITIESINFIGPGMETDMRFFRGYLLKNFRFKNNHVSNFGRTALMLTDVMGCIIEGCIFENIFMTGYGYSIALDNACSDVTIRNNVFKGVGRHYIVGSAGLGSYSFGGFNRNINIIDNIFQNSTDEAINTHDPFMGPINITGNSFSSCAKGIELINAESNIDSNIFSRCWIGIEFRGDEKRLINIGSNEFSNCRYDVMIDVDIDKHSVVTGNISGIRFFLNDGMMRVL